MLLQSVDGVSSCLTKMVLYFIYFQSLSENDLGVVGAMVIDEVLNSNSWLTQLNLSGESPTNAKAGSYTYTYCIGP